MDENTRPNPFAVPESVSAEARLSDDAGQVVRQPGEYIVYRQSIVFRGNLELPPICISTGQTTNLIRRERRFPVAQYSLLPSIVIFLIFAGLMYASAQLFSYVLVGIIVLQYVGWNLVARFSKNESKSIVRVCWSISQSQVRFYRRLSIGLRLIAVLACTVGGTQFGTTSSENIFAGFVMLTISLPLSLLFSTEPQMQLRGTKLLGRNRGSRIAHGHGLRFYNTFRTRQSSYAEEPLDDHLTE